MTTRHDFREQLQELQKEVVRMATMASQAIEAAVRALKDRDLDLAQQVVAGDDAIDALELEIERRCLELIALQQPVAGDLRQISAVFRLITDIERMADHAQAIAKVALRIGHEPLVKPLVDIPRMAAIATAMVHDALTAYVRRDEALARQMIERDHELDHLFKQVFDELLQLMIRNAGTIEQATQLLFVASHLERVGDHATNIGEWVIYILTGVRPELNN